MTVDEVIREVRSLREAYAARLGFDIRAFYEDAKRREQQADRQVVSLEPKIVEHEAIEK